MDSYEWNKIAGAVLFAALVSLGLGIFSETLFESEEPETPAYVIAVATEAGAPEGEVAAQPIGVLLAAADPKAGESAAKKCGACHTFGQGEANKVGPNLWNVVNRQIASHEGYEYDDAMKSFAEQAGTWTFEHLDTFLHDPKGTVPGTKMAFAGLKNDSERANVIAYLRTLSDSPAPLPEAAAAETAPETEVASTEPTAPAEPAAPAPAPEAPAAAEAPAQPAAEAPAAEAAAPAPAPAEPPGATQPAEQQTAQTETPAAPAAATPTAGDVAKGETFAKRCAVCHDMTAAAVKKVGPPLHGVVGRPVAAIADFAYSDAMKAFSEGGAKVWDDVTLDAYLVDPKGSVPGTKMVFTGIKAEADRANVIADLNTLK
jgi:cytochrome c2